MDDSDDTQDNIMRVPSYKSVKSLKSLEYEQFYRNVVSMNWKQPRTVTRSKTERAYLTVVEQNFNDEPFRKLELLSRVHSLQASDIWRKHDGRTTDFSDPEVVDYYSRRQPVPMLSEPFRWRWGIDEYDLPEAVLKRWCEKIDLDYDLMFPPLYRQAKKRPNSINYVKFVKLVMGLDTPEEEYIPRNDMDQIWFEFLGVLCPLWSFSDHDVYPPLEANQLLVTCKDAAADEFWAILDVHMRNKRAEIATKSFIWNPFIHSPDGGLTKYSERKPLIKMPGPPPYGNEVVASFHRPLLKRKRSIYERANDVVSEFRRRILRVPKPVHDNDSNDDVIVDQDFDGAEVYDPRKHEAKTSNTRGHKNLKPDDKTATVAGGELSRVGEVGGNEATKETTVSGKGPAVVITPSVNRDPTPLAFPKPAIKPVEDDSISSPAQVPNATNSAPLEEAIEPIEGTSDSSDSPAEAPNPINSALPDDPLEGYYAGWQLRREARAAFLNEIYVRAIDLSWRREEAIRQVDFVIDRRETLIRRAQELTPAEQDVIRQRWLEDGNVYPDDGELEEEGVWWFDRAEVRGDVQAEDRY